MERRKAGRAPEGPGDLPKRSWWAVLKRTATGFGRDGVADWAATLTYYGVLSLFPGLIVVTALLGLLGSGATRSVLDTAGQVVPGQARTLLVAAVGEVSGARGAAGPLAVLGLLAALWSASGYVGAFMRAANAIYGTPEGRPVWKVWPLRLLLTVVVMAVLVVCAGAVVATGSLARRIGEMLGIGSAGVTVWDIAKWPVLAVVVSLVFALLYWAAPNVRQPGFRWLTPGGLLAVLVWVVASAGFAFYVANFGSYNKTYGSLAAVIVFLVWLWISNIALLLGAELDAELARGRRIEAGGEAEEEPVLPPRDQPSS